MIENGMELKFMYGSAVSVGLTAITAWIGSWDLALKILFFMIVIDYVSGIMKGAAGEGLSSAIGAKGIIKKATIFIIVLIAHLIDQVALNSTPLFRTGAAYFYIANEGISILENATALGVPVPEFISKALLIMKEQNDGLNQNETGTKGV